MPVLTAPVCFEPSRAEPIPADSVDCKNGSLLVTPRRVPPPYEATCPLRERAVGGIQPVITSPKKDLAYAVPIAKKDEVQIPLSAFTDAGVREVYWFADEQFLGKADSHRPMFWHPRIGKQTIRAVDDQGRSDSTEINVTAIQ